MAELDRLIRELVEADGSDIHLSAGQRPMIRVDGDVVALDQPELPGEETLRLLEEIMPERNRAELAEANDTDFAYEIPDYVRLRVNVFRDRNGVGGVLRVIPSEVISADMLGLPSAVTKLCELSKGLVVVTGPTGSGKSTTLAAMIDHINTTRHEHIITIEDPIEFVHRNKNCLINQREVHNHTRSFAAALRAALRQDPDIVLVGEMRDLETIEIAIETAETGHLVFGTLHTNTASSTIDRIINVFPAGQQNQIRSMLAGSLKGVLAQNLCKRQGGGRVAAFEILMVDTGIANMIRESKIQQIPSAMQVGRKQGMQLLNDALVDFVRRGVVDAREAYFRSAEKRELLARFQKYGIPLPSVAE